MFSKSRQELAAFTLIEILVVVALIGILAAVVIANMSGTTAAGRDAQRQADLRAMQNAIELYKQRWGRYPEGCRSNGTLWSGQPGTAFACPGGSSRYIVGLEPSRPFSAFMAKLPLDNKLPTDPVFQNKVGYAYITNAEGSVYKLMAMNTVESELVNYTHPFKSCDIIPNASTGSIIESSSQASATTSGWCQRGFASAVGVGLPETQIPSTFAAPGSYVRINKCRAEADFSSGVEDDLFFPNSMRRFERSYGVWGGYAPELSAGTYAARIRPTTAVICR